MQYALREEPVKYFPDPSQFEKPKS